jgi:MOSC domain-containing protein YiiM
MDVGFDGREPAWESGIFKEPVTHLVRVSAEGLEGDGQADLVNHAGPDKAVLAYSADHYPGWRDELGPPELPFGAFGENLTVSGWDEARVCVGDIVRVGVVRMQVSQQRQPCWKLARRLERADMVRRVVETGRSGWYLRVLEEGEVAAGMEMVLLERPEGAVPIWR